MNNVIADLNFVVMKKSECNDFFQLKFKTNLSEIKLDGHEIK